MALAGTAFVWRELDAIRVKGRAQAVRIFEPIGVAGQVAPELMSRARTYEKGLGHYRSRNFTAAAEQFALVCRTIRRQQYFWSGPGSSCNSPPARTGSRSARRSRNSHGFNAWNGSPKIHARLGGGFAVAARAG